MPTGQEQAEPTLTTVVPVRREIVQEQAAVIATDLAPADLTQIVREQAAPTDLGPAGEMLTDPAVQAPIIVARGALTTEEPEPTTRTTAELRESIDVSRREAERLP